MFKELATFSITICHMMARRMCIALAELVELEELALRTSS
jgi:hypothetical protein